MNPKQDQSIPNTTVRQRQWVILHTYVWAFAVIPELETRLGISDLKDLWDLL